MKFYPLADMSMSQMPTASQDIVSALFEKSSKLTLLQREFAKVLMMSPKKRERWVSENQDFIQQLLFAFRKDSSMAITDDVIASSVGKQQITEYMVRLQQALSTLEQIVFGADQPEH